MGAKAYAVHQFHGSSSLGDAITNGLIYTRDLLRSLGFRSEIYCEDVEPRLAAAMCALAAMLFLGPALFTGRVLSPADRLYDFWPWQAAAPPDRAGAANGVLIDSGVSGTFVQANFIGVDASGGSALGNGANGVGVLGSNNTIGGSSGGGNTISGNQPNGVLVYS